MDWFLYDRNLRHENVNKDLNSPAFKHWNWFTRSLYYKENLKSMSSKYLRKLLELFNFCLFAVVVLSCTLE